MIYFARMLDKIRKHDAGELREDFCDNLGTGFDGRCLDYLRVNHADLRTRVRAGDSDAAILTWCFENGRPLSEGDILIWNQFLTKSGWQDGNSETLARRKRESGLEDHDEIQTMLEYFEYDEGRKK